MRVKFTPYNNPIGFAPLTESGTQNNPTYVCKESFASRMKKLQLTGAVMYFLRKDKNTGSPEVAKRQQKVLRLFEKAMGIKPYATVKVVTRKAQVVKNVDAWYGARTRRVPEQSFFLYRVSKEWRRSTAMLHILALLVRNYTPEDVPLDWKAVLKHFAGHKDWVALPAITEIVQDKGNLVPNVNDSGGINCYHHNLKTLRAQMARMTAEAQDAANVQQRMVFPG